MNKFVKRLVSVACCLFIALPVAFSACAKTGGGDENNTQNPDPVPEEPTPDNPTPVDPVPEEEELVKYVNTLAGDLSKGATIAGPAMPNGSIHPSPETLNPENGGYRTGEKVVGFGQLYSQGTGGHQSYGNFLLSPQTGAIETAESAHASTVSGETGTANYYCANLDKYGVFAEITPCKNSAMYRFTYGSGDGSLLFDISRKIGGSIALQSGDIAIDKSTNTVSGGGTFSNNWNPAPWNMFVAMRFDKTPMEIGVWDGTGLNADKLSGAGINSRLGAYINFDTTVDKTVLVKIAISFESEEKALGYLEEQLPEWDFDKVKQNGEKEWNKILGGVKLGGEVSTEQKSKFYSAVYLANIHPRDRVSDSGEWDDYYTVWDSWKSVFPFLTLTHPEVVAENVNSFIRRSEENGIMTDAYIQGKEFLCGQGGNDIENIIADAYLKRLDGVDWQSAYSAVKKNAEVLRSKSYLARGYQGSDSAKTAQNGLNYSYRLYPSSATMGFAFNDYAVSVMAKDLGTSAEYEKYSARAENWKNIWNPTCTSDGFSGFAQNRTESGSFASVSNAATGYNSHYYEANIWEGSFYPVYDVPSMMELMGGRQEFTKRLGYACANGKIKFDNEPAFQTVWLFSNENVRRPDLTAKYANEFLKYFPAAGGYHDDEDGGAMSTMYIFLLSGYFPMSCTNNYYLHGTRLPQITYSLGNGNKFVIKGVNTSSENIYVQSATWNGKPLNECWLTYEQISAGGTLEFVMGSEPGSWGKFEEDAVTPDNVTALQADVTRAEKGIADLSWNKVENTQISRYLVYCGDSEDFVPSESNLVAETLSNRYIGFASAGNKYYKVIAVGANGNVSKTAATVSVDIGQNFGSAKYGETGENIALGKTATASGMSAPAGTSNYDLPAYAVDGKTNTKWSCRSTETNPQDGTGNYWLEVDLGEEYVISRWQVLHAQSGGESVNYNTRAFRLQAKADGEWIDADVVDGNQSRKTDRITVPFAARYVRLYITQPVQSGDSVSARIYEFALFSHAENPESRIDFTEEFNGTSKPEGFTQNVTGGGYIDFSEDGLVTLSTQTSGTVELDKVFDDEFSGVLIHEIRFKNMSSSHSEFANIVFLKNSGNNSYIVTIAIETGRLRYNEGSGWKTVQHNGKDVYLLDGEWYTLKVVNDYDNQKTKLYLTGERFGNGSKTAVSELGTDVYLGEYDFRNKNAGNPDTFEMAIGTGKDYTCYAVDYIKIYEFAKDNA